MIKEILVPFMAMFLAELGDKTQLATLCLAAKTKKHLKLLLGVIIAFIIADGLAIILGRFITKIVETEYITIGSAIIFIIFGIWIVFNNKKHKENHKLKRPFFTGLIVILILEMGDKSQIASGLFATQFTPILVFIGIMCALIILSTIAVYIGKLIVTNKNERIITAITGAVFIIIGLSFLF